VVVLGCAGAGKATIIGHMVYEVCEAIILATI